MKLSMAAAAREILAELWRSRGGIALYALLSALWLGLAGASAWACAATGLGESWGFWRMAASCAGAATQVFLAMAIPLAAAADDVEAHSSFHEAPWRPAADDGAVLAAGIAGLVVLALDLARFAGPLIEPWAPLWLVQGAAWWWLAVDIACAVVGAGLWAALGAGGAAEVLRSALSVAPARWREIERWEVERASKPAKRRGSGPKRL